MPETLLCVCFKYLLFKNIKFVKNSGNGKHVVEAVMSVPQGEGLQVGAEAAS